MSKLGLIQENFLTVSGGHQVYYAEYGQPDGLPILFLHGGPGGRSKPSYLNILPAEFEFRAVLMDQRGCGQSTPVGSTRHNTSSDLVQDIEQLRQKLAIDKWWVTGSSWGSTLALLYAETHPQAVAGLLLRSVFLARQADVAWLYQQAGQFFPDLYSQIQQYLSEQNITWQQLPEHGLQILEQSDQDQINRLVNLISGWESALYQLSTPYQANWQDQPSEDEINSTRILLHYWQHQFFVADNQILKQAHALQQIPTIIIHGRYDMVCPPIQAYLLHQALPQSQLHWVNFAAHHLGWDGADWSAHLLADYLKQTGRVRHSLE